MATLVGALRAVHASFRAGQPRLVEGLLKLVKGKVKKRAALRRDLRVEIMRRSDHDHGRVVGPLASGRTSSAPWKWRPSGASNTGWLRLERACGFRTYRAVEVAPYPYHNLGRLPEPDFTHRFC